MIDDVPVTVELKSSHVLGSGCLERKASTVASLWCELIQMAAPRRGAGWRSALGVSKPPQN
jgi:hypothetical protein